MALGCCRRSSGPTRRSGSNACGRAIDALRIDPPELIRGDYVELLPRLLADRRPARSRSSSRPASLVYLPEGGLARVRAALEAASQVEPIAFLSSGHHEHGYVLELERYPGGAVERLGVFDFHGAWLEWGR